MDGSMSPIALSWMAPELTPADRTRALLTGRRLAPLRLAGWTIRFIPPQPIANAEPIPLTIAGEPAALHAPRALVDAILAGLDPAAPQAEGAARPLLLALALEPALTAIVPALDIQLGDEPATGTGLGLSCTDESGTRFAATLIVSPATLHRIAAALAHWPAEPMRDPAWTLPVAIRIGAADLALADLRGLQPGDVILPTAMAPGAAQAALVLGERHAWRADLAHGQIAVISARRPVGELGLEGWVMDAAPNDQLADAPLDEIPVRLLFEIGRIELPLGELGAIAPGHVFALGRDAQQPVDITVQGRRIGQGEIVAMGGTLGVRVIWLGAPG